MAAADARILARLSDATILAVRWGSTRRQAVKMSVRQLLAAGAPLAGGLLTMVNAKKHAQKKRELILADKINVTRFLVWYVSNYPESDKIIKMNPEYQLKFR